MISVPELMRAVARVSGVSYDVLTSRTRARPIARQRMAIMFVLQRKGGMTEQQIARAMKLDRTTVDHGIDQCWNFLQRRDQNMIRYYRIAIRQFIKARRAETNRRAEARATSTEGTIHAFEHQDRVRRPEFYPGYDNLDWVSERLRAAA